MGILEVLTIVFVVLKLTGVIAWSWWAVFIPMYVAIAWYALILGLYLASLRRFDNDIKMRNKRRR